MKKLLLQLTFLCCFAAACDQEKPKQPAEQEKPKAELQLKKTTFNQLKGFQKDNIAEAYTAFYRSCEVIKNYKSEFMGHAAIKIPTAAYKKICAKLPQIQPQNFKEFVRENFVPYQVRYNGRSEGKFTAYYEAAINASHQPSETYKFPIYGKPADLIEFNPKDFDPTMPSKRMVGRVVNQKLIPYYTRDEIFKNGFKAPVILWADSYIDLYIMQIQGSAVAELDDGSKVRIGFADTNGRDFRGIGNILLSKGLLKPGQASMGNIKKWLNENLQTAYEHMNDNQRYVFHRLVEAEGPIGALGVPLTAGRSLAVDKNYIPLGALLWLETSGPNREKIQRLVAAQDIGGAIKGAIRGDYFWGSGHDDVLELAGKMNGTGRYFILLPKGVEVQINE